MANFNDIRALVNQAEQAGADIGTLLQSFQALSTTNKTSLGLNQWSKTDKPTMEDFNKDNQIVDDEIRALQANKANVGPPQVYEIAFVVDIVTSSSYYFKDQFGIVTLQFSCNRSSVGFARNDIIGTLPEGFRPKKQREIPILYNANNAPANGSIYIKTNGQIAIGHENQNAIGLSSSCISFLATQ